MMRDDATRPYRFGSGGAAEQPTDEIELPGGPYGTEPATSPFSVDTSAGETTVAMPPVPDDPPYPTRTAPAAPPPASSGRVVHPTPAAPVPQALPVSPGAAPAPRSASPHLIRRIVAPVLALPLCLTGILLSCLGLAGTFVSILTGSDGEGLLGTATLGALAAGAVICFLLCALTARLSASGTVLSGAGCLVFGAIALVWPDALTGWLSGLPGMPEGFDEVIGSLAQLVNAIVGILALTLGATLLGSSLAVRGARGEGWKRGAGR